MGIFRFEVPILQGSYQVIQEHWAIPLNRDTPPIDDMILFNPRDRQRRTFCGPGTDIFGFTTLVQMPQSNQSRPWDRHVLLYYPGTDGSVQPKQTLGRQTLHCSGVGTVVAVVALAATLFRL